MTNRITFKKPGTFDVNAAKAAQIAYCDTKNLPLFAPRSGYCYCGSNIYTDNGFSVEEAGQRHITYCPHCHRSFTD